MTHMKYLWTYPEEVPIQIDKELEDYTPAFRSILYRRGCHTALEAISFLLPNDPNFPPEIQLGHIDLACSIISNSIKNNHKIAIFGDYDADGITATALLTLALNKISSAVKPIIPHRLIDGYGLNKRSIDDLHQEDYKLLVTVDNGIRSNDEVAYAKSLGFQVIITDHHQPPDLLPAADAIINQKLPGDPYPNKNLAGVGVAYKLVCGLANIFPQIDPEDYLDLVAIGTIADIVPLIGENRYLVKRGLLRANQYSRPGLTSLLGIAGLKNKRLTASDISYQIGPRINSSGRLGGNENLYPLDLLLSTDPRQCGELAQEIELHNDRRKDISRRMQDRIEAHLKPADSHPNILISLDPENHQGIAGITAGYLTGKYYLPSVVGKVGPDKTTASCRSIPEFDMVSALDANRDLLSHFGGHKLAAGFTIANQNVPELKKRLHASADLCLSDLDLSPSLAIDALVTLPDLGHNLFKELAKLEPTGERNPRPIFALQDVFASKVDQVGASKDHLKLIISDGKVTIPAIGFGLGSLANAIPDRFRVAFHFNENEYGGKKEYQLQILDLQPS